MLTNHVIVVATRVWGLKSLADVYIK